MDSWYAVKWLMLKIDNLGKIYYCPLKKNRLVKDDEVQEKHQPIQQLNWSEDDLKQGKTIHIHKFPKNHKVKLFCVQVSANRTEYIATNDMSQNSADDTRSECAIRWKIEEFHREIKQLTGLEKCQARTRRIQKNHIACSILVWARLKQIAHKIGKTVYQIKNELLTDYLIQQLQKPTWKFVGA